MNYNKVIKDLKERNNTLAHQYRLRDMRCINLEQENEKLNKQLNELQKPQIFIDTQDIEEEYGEGLYQDYLEEKVETLKKQLEVGEQQYNDLIEENEKLEEQLSSITLELEEYKKELEIWKKRYGNM